MPNLFEHFRGAAYLGQRQSVQAERRKKKFNYFFLPKRSLFYQKIVQTEVIEKKEALRDEVPLNALSFKVAYL